VPANAAEKNKKTMMTDVITEVNEFFGHHVVNMLNSLSNSVDLKSLSLFKGSTRQPWLIW